VIFAWLTLWNYDVTPVCVRVRERRERERERKKEEKKYAVLMPANL